MVLPTGGWLVLVVAVLLVPGPSPAVRRATLLGGRGRLAPVVVDASGRRYGIDRSGWRPAGRVVSRLIGPLAGLAVTPVGGIALGVATGAAVGCLVLLVRDRTATRRDREYQKVVAAAVRVAVGELDTGASAAAALRGAAGALVAAGRFEPSDGRRRRLAHRDDRVRDDVQARLRRLAESMSPTDRVEDVAPAAESGDRGAAVDGLRLVEVACEASEATGAPLASVLGRVAEDLEAKRDRARELETSLAGPRSSAAVLAALPVLGVALGASMGASPLGWLLAQPTGRAVCCAGVLLDMAGLLWLRRLLSAARSG